MSMDRMADANKRHAELTEQIRVAMKANEGTDTPAVEDAKIDAMLSDLDSLTAEIKGYVDEAETKAERLSRIEQADRFRTESAGKLPGMGLGGSAAVRTKGDELERAGVVKRGGWIGAEIKGEFVGVYNEDDFGRRSALRYSATPE